ncbi:hypothetical protein EBT16_07835 [bacterium]|nr:hypothetical protein [bacterium]
MESTQRQTPTEQIKVKETVQVKEQVQAKEQIQVKEQVKVKEQVQEPVKTVGQEPTPAAQPGLEPIDTTDEDAVVEANRAAVLDAAKVEAEKLAAAAEKKKTKATGKKTVFYSKQQFLSVTLDMGTQVNFVNHKADVPAELVDRLTAHHLTQQGHILNSSEAILAGNTVVSLKYDSDAVKSAVERIKRGRDADKEQDEFLFVFDGKDAAVVRLGMEVVDFTNGKAIVGKEYAERLRKHIFFQQGVIKELFIA